MENLLSKFQNFAVVCAGYHISPNFFDGMFQVSPKYINESTNLIHHDENNYKIQNVEDDDPILVSRKEWGALNPKRAPGNLTISPPKWVVFSHTATPPCFIEKDCLVQVKLIQKLCVESKGWGNVGFNFLVGGDGNVYEGLGWGVEGARTKPFNPKSLGIALIGDFQNMRPTDAQLDATKKFLEYAVEQNQLDPNYKIIVQRQVIVTNSPGRMAYQIIRTWDRWTPL
ncbi:hypothetical protein QAD02_006493 [Eretmocerus hayati]|uniref:Uncharacterized protein n=1 Tax=Eretmocerus hayati TaxID=131215 RepID=A0ACC2N1V1_9HYME|nr:hypothetical protein QAD02_006493 [Eretmocerus hayati]